MVRRFAALYLALLLLPALLGQEFRATITGRVVDAQSAAMPNVKITATLTSTGAQSLTTTGVDGLYTIPFLTPGVYRVDAEISGFRRYIRENVDVAAGARLGLDITLEVGQANDSITVTAEAPALDTTTATAGQNISSLQVESLPMNGRTPLVLAQLAMGVVPNSDPKFNRPFDNAGPSQFSMGGAPAQNNELLVNGAPDTTWDLRVAYNPPVDAVQEVRVHAFEADAAYGHTGGGTANVILKSGSNEVHASLYEFNQVSNLAATNFFTNKAGQKKPAGRYNQWGGSAGAPLYIPKVYNGKNRVFWFYAMEFINDSFPEPQTVMVPTEAERGGDLSSLLRIGPAYQIYDPYSGAVQGSRIARTPIPGNIIPSSRINAVAKNLMQFYPLPNQPGGADGTNNYLAPAARTDTYNAELGRLDFNISDKDKLFWDFRHNDRIEDRNDLFRNPTNGRGLLRINWGTTLDYVRTLTNTTVANVRLSFNRFREANVSHGDGFDATKLGFPAYIAGTSSRLTFPHIQFNSTTAGAAFQQFTDTASSNRPYNIFSIFGDVVRVFGQHSVKAGVDIREHRDSNIAYGTGAEGSFTFDSTWTKGPLDNSTAAPVGQDWASFLLGLPSAGGYDLNAFRTNQSKYLALFVQDDWRVRPNLTLNLGLRFEGEFDNTERFNRTIIGFDNSTPSPIAAAAIAAYNKNPIPEIPAGQFAVNGGVLFATPSNRAMYSPQSRMFSPRLGFAWTPLGPKTVLRGGAGVFMFPISNPTYNQPGFSQTTVLVPTLDSYLTPYATLSNPFPDGIQSPTGSKLGLATNLGTTLAFTNPLIRNPYSVRWELSVQRELPANVIFEAAYIGNHAVHLISLNRELDSTVPAQYLSKSPVRDQTVINNLTALVTNPFAGLIPGKSLNGSNVAKQQLLLAFPQFTAVTLQNTNAASSYFHSVDLRFEKRIAHGLTMLTNFTYSKLIARDNYKNDFDLSPEKRVAADDRPLRFVASASYQVPFGQNKALSFHSKALNRVLGGWVVNTIYTSQIGAPLTFGNNLLYYGGPLNNNPHPSNLNAPMFDVTRFNLVSSQQLDRNVHTFGTRYGNLRQDGAANIDLSVLKDTRISERVNFQLRFEAFNAFNRPQFDVPKSTIDNPTNSAFGKITNQPNLPRSIQMGARLVF